MDLAASGSKVAPVEAKFGRDKNLVEQGEEKVEAAFQHINNFQAIVSSALSLLPKPEKGRPSVIAFDAFVWKLAHLYERETGRAAKGRPFHNLVHACAEPLMTIYAKTPFEKHVWRALKERPKQGD